MTFSVVAPGTKQPKTALPTTRKQTFSLYPTQYEFVTDAHANCGFVAGRGCVAPETIIDGIPIAERSTPGPVQTLLGEAQASAGYPKGRDDLYRVRTESGSEVLVTRQHRFLTPVGWRQLDNLCVGAVIAADGSSRDCLAMETRPDFVDRYYGGSHHSDVVPRIEEEVARNKWRPPHMPAGDNNARCLVSLLATAGFSLPQRPQYDVLCPLYADACGLLPGQLRNPLLSLGTLLPTDNEELWHLRGGDRAGAALPAQLECHYSAKSDLPFPAPAPVSPPPHAGFLISQILATLTHGQCGVCRFSLQECLAHARLWPLVAAICLDSWQRQSGFQISCRGEEFPRPSSYLSPYNYYNTFWDKIATISHSRYGEFYDLAVPGVEHYSAQGLWHHNSGKTYASVVKDFVYALEHPGARVLVCAPTYTLLRDNTRATFLDICPRDYIVRYSQKENTVALRNNSMLYFRSLDQPNLLRGYTVAAVHIDEAAFVSKEASDIVRACLRQPGYPLQRWISTTPKGRNWVWEEFELNKSADHALYRARSSDNPYMPRNYEESMGYTGLFYKQEILGLFESFEGLVYPTFTRDLIVPIPNKNDFGRVVAGVDFGYTDPATIEVIGQSKDKSRIYALDEYYVKNVTIDDHIKAARTLKERWGISMFICDPSRPDSIEMFRRAGLPVTKGHNDLLGGITKVASYLPREIGSADTSRFFVSASCKNLVIELENYGFQTTVEGDIKSEKPIDDFNHAADCIRYGCVYLAQSSRRDIRF